MPTLDTYRKQAKQLLRWHRERNYSLGGKVRLLERYRQVTDVEVLDTPLPLTLAQEIVAVEAGFPDWTALKKSAADAAPAAAGATGTAVLSGSTPILFVRDVVKAAGFYADSLGFNIDFLHGNPPFYGAVSRDGACLHLRFVHTESHFPRLAAHEQSLILVTTEVSNVKRLFEEYEGRGVEFVQRLVRQAWGGLDFHVRDPDGNVISFVEYRHTDGATG